jgi:hypothetical protein
MSESVYGNMFYFGSEVIDDPTPFLHVSDNFPFEEDLALYLNNFEFHLPKDDLYHV